MVKKWMWSLLFISSLAFAGSNQSVVYQGRLTRPDGTFPESSVTFNLNVYSPNPSHCLLYGETHILNLAGAQGLFSLYLGTGARNDSGSHSFNDIFVNGKALTSLTCSSGNSYTGASTDDREFEVTVNDGGSTVTFSPIQIKSVPFAMQAHEIDGWGVSNLLKVSTVASPTTFTTSELSNVKSVASASCTNNEILKWNGSAWACATDATGGTPSDATYAAKGILQVHTNAATSGLDLTSGVLKLATSGVTSGNYGTATKIPSLQIDSFGRVISANEVSISVLAPGDSAGGDLTGTYPNPTLANGVVNTAKLFSNPGVNRIVATDNSTGTTLAPMSCTSGQLLTWDTSNGWQCTNNTALSVGSAANVTGTVGISNGGTGNTSHSYVTLTDTTVISWNLSGTINHAVVTLGGNRTLLFSGLTNGMNGTLIVKQDSTGGRTLTLPGQCTNRVIAGGSGILTLSSSPNSVDILTFTYDGTTCYWAYGNNYN